MITPTRRPLIELARRHADWVKEDPALRSSYYITPIRDLAQVTLINIDIALRTERSSIRRKALEDQRATVKAIYEALKG